MAKTIYRDGVNPGYLVKRKIGYQRQGQLSLDPVIVKLDALLGMQQVTHLEKKCTLVFSYDGSKLDIDQILEILVAANLTLKTGWWATRTLNHYRFIDQNVRDNAKHVPVCCSKPPPEVARRLRQS